MTDTEPLLLTRDGTVATLTINRPRRLNALTYAMFSQLPKLLEEAAAMPGLQSGRNLPRGLDGFRARKTLHAADRRRGELVPPARERVHGLLHAGRDLMVVARGGFTPDARE